GRPGARSLGPMRSKKMYGPTMRRFAKGSTRPTSKAPRSRRRGGMSSSIMAASFAGDGPVRPLWQQSRRKGKGVDRPGRRPGSERGPQARALLDGAPGVQLRGHIGAADQVHAAAGGTQRPVQLAQRFLAGAQHDAVDFQQGGIPALFPEADLQATVVDALVV